MVSMLLLTRGLQCIHMPVPGCRVRRLISALSTPSGPPICTQAWAGHYRRLRGAYELVKQHQSLFLVLSAPHSNCSEAMWLEEPYKEQPSSSLPSAVASTRRNTGSSRAWEQNSGKAQEHRGMSLSSQRTRAASWNVKRPNSMAMATSCSMRARDWPMHWRGPVLKARKRLALSTGSPCLLLLPSGVSGIRSALRSAQRSCTDVIGLAVSMVAGRRNASRGAAL